MLQVLLGHNITYKNIEKEELELILNTYYFRNESTLAIRSEDAGSKGDFLSKVIDESLTCNASDIHFEVFGESCRIRFRIDGKLFTRFNLSIEKYPYVVNKIKINSNLNISEKRLPQDGRMVIKVGNESIDVRVSTIPVSNGEKIVLRLLQSDAKKYQLNRIGFSDQQLRNVLKSIKKMQGIILVSGPTGSGKTTTLYSILNELNKPDVNILTVEDPVEYSINGINQVQLKENVGLDYSTALRAFLRQDPDVIMVGEIRDEQTAEIAIRSALTGHLVLSTIHTNSALGSIHRLMDMGLPAFLLSSTISMSIAQRLLRVLCPTCKRQIKVDESISSQYRDLLMDNEFYYEAVGCPECFNTGYKGRTAVFEVVPFTGSMVNDFLKDYHDKPEKYLSGRNISSLQNQAIKLLRNGITSLDEISPILLSKI
ncbi:MAG: GspE/PulE family protein [Bacteroidales bacterium]|nr:GspE/PulE family protein [Bacteroidales bacterium]